MVTLPVGWMIAAVEPSGRWVTVQVYSMGTPLRLAKMVGVSFWPALSVIWPPAETLNGDRGSRQSSGLAASVTTQYLVSHPSPTASPSSSPWSLLATLTQLSVSLPTLSL